MANRRPRPIRGDSQKSKTYKFVKKNLVPVQGTTFNRLTVVWVQNNGVPFNTTGFFATLTRNNVIVSTAAFDSFGVARFNNIPVLTRVSFTIRTFNANGVLFRRRTIPAGVQTFAIIG
jgi:hypothetical protein